MTRLLLLIVLASVLGTVRAQDGFESQSGAPLSINVFDRNGKAFVNPAPDVAGTPFLTDAWQWGALVVNTNRRFDSVKIRLNLLSHEVHVLDKNNIEIVLAKGYIKELFLPNVVTGRLVGGPRYQNGFPPVDMQDSNNFYQVLTQGKLWLLHSIRKVIVTEKDDLSGDVKKEYRTYEDIYIYDGKTMQRVKKDKAPIGGNEIKFKSIDQLKQAIDAYNAS